jgi:hypothetical protein
MNLEEEREVHKYINTSIVMLAKEIDSAVVPLPVHYYGLSIRPFLTSARIATPISIQITYT